MATRPREHYDFIPDKGYVCSTCTKVFKYKTNAIRHVSEKHITNYKDEPPVDQKTEQLYTYKTQTGITKTITKSTQEILEWKNKYGVSMRAVCNPFFKKIVKDPDAVHCRELMTTMQASIAAQVLERNSVFFKNTVISIIMDGGTVIHTKWIAVLGYSKNETRLLDLWIVEESCTIQNIVSQIKNLQSNLSSLKIKIVGACTDNGANMRGCFNNTIGKNVSSFYITDILRVSCACHSMQLIIEDFLEEDNDFKKLVAMLSEFPKKLSHLTEKRIRDLGLTGYPPVQPQRWNSIHISLQYVLKNIEVLSKEFGGATLFNQGDYFLQIEEVLAPLHDFTTNLEGDHNDQSDVFIQYQILRQRWTDLKKGGNPNAGKLLKILDARTKNTIDIQLAELAYFYSCRGMNEFAEQYPYFPEHMADDPEVREQIIARYKKTRQLNSKLQQVCAIWKIDAEVVSGLWSELTVGERNFTHKYLTKLDIMQFFPDEKTKEVVMFVDFINRIASLPASEASSERIFAEMRELFSEKSTQLTPETLREVLIMNYVTKKNANE